MSRPIAASAGGRVESERVWTVDQCDSATVSDDETS